MREWIQEEHREHKMYAGADGEAIPEEFREARNKGLYYLQFSGKTENEMRKKLAEQEFSPASVEKEKLRSGGTGPGKASEDLRVPGEKRLFL